MKEAKQIQITEGICKQVGLMRKGGASQAEIAKLLGLSPCTISRIETAGFDRETYEENQRQRREKEKRKTEEQEKEPAEEPVTGQIRMDLDSAEGHLNVPMSDQTKMMRFQAAQVDKLYMKLEKINDTLCQILRAVRRE